MVRVFATLFLVAALLILPVSAWAETSPIGTIVEVEGEGALVMRDAEQGKAYPAKADDAVYLNDVVQTGPGGRMLVLLLDDSRFTLGENARFKVDDYAYDDENDSGNKARYNVLQGVFLYASGLIAKKENPDVKIAIPYGSIGIRGTTVWGGVLDEEYGVFVAEGEVTVETNRGRIRVAQSEGTTIRNANAIPERAKVWGEPKVTRATSTIALKHPEKVKERIAFHQQNRAEIVAKHRALIRAKRLDPAVTPRGESIKEIRPLHQKPVAPVSPEKKKILEEKKEILKEKIEERKEGKIAPVAPPNVPVAPTPPAATPEKSGAAEKPFPRPAVAEKIAPENLPTDPAKRQEAIERQMLQKRAPAPAPVRPRVRDPFQ